MSTIMEMAQTARESTSVQWEAYYAAKAQALRAQAETNRLYAAAERLNPIARGAAAAGYERQAVSYDLMAAELAPEPQS